MKTKLTSLTLAVACLALLCATSVSLRAATITVTSTNDSGAGTLRAALASAANGDSIDATGVSGTITLTSGQLNVANSVTLLGPGPGLLTVSGNNNSRVFNITATNVTISGLTIANGQSGLNGAGINAGGSPGSVLTVSGCVITNNSASQVGGGIYNGNGGMMTVSNCSIVGNSASWYGGGIYNIDSTLKVVSSTLSGNSASYGGGIHNWGNGGSATLTINASTFSGNSASYGGGGIVNLNVTATLTINASTLSGNSGSYGGGIYNLEGTLELGDTILNAGASGENIYTVGTATSYGYNLSSDGGGGFLTATGDQINTDPKLGPLQDNGGPTWTHALLAGSPAIDRGKTNAIPALARSTDQRGFMRPVDFANIPNASGGDGSDIGAVETQYRLVVSSTADNGPGSLRRALANTVDGCIIDVTGITGTITLTSGQLNVPTSVTLLGPGPGILTVSGNNASGVFNVTGTNVTISGLTIANGQTVYGAGINAGGGPGSVFSLSGCVITNNSATQYGGGIYNNPGVTMTVSNCSILNNSASWWGGGICNDTATLKVVASTLGANSAMGDGGGIMNLAASGGSATLAISVSTLSGNSASAGGGIYNEGVSGSATLTINASTFSGNSGGFGGGSINNYFATLEIGDTILNAGAAGGNIYNNSGLVTSDGYNLSSDDGGGFLTVTGDQINTDPMLGPLQDNGGPTWTHALLARSPAIDRGKTNAIPALARSTDQRGFARPVDFVTDPNASGGDGSDIGAFEFQKTQPPTVTSTDDSGPGTLREALASAANGDTIDATGATGTITLTNGQLNIPTSVTLRGPGPGLLTVSGNNASRVFNVTGTNVTISGLTIANGQSGLNGAGINAGGSPGSALTVSGCVLTNNSAWQNGGGIYISNGVALTVSNCTISGNSAASGGGGGIGNQNGALTVVASTLSGNSAGVGGGIDNDGASGGNATLTVNASTFSSNSAYAGGGGILNWGQSGSATLTINASTFSGNSAGGSGGGGILNNNDAGTGTVVIADTILNAGAAGGNIYNYSGPVTSDGYNLSSDDGGGLLTATGDQINTDPKLGPLQDNGGPTWTHALLAGSPAIDRGKTNAIPALARATDQRGLARPVDNPYLANATGGDGSDIGAFEVQGSGGYDTDGDGLPDFWELAWFGNLSQSGTDDFDGTGQNNLFKFIAGLDPIDPTSVFTLRVENVAGQPNQMNLIFKPWVSGRTYSAQFTTNLATTAFAPLTGYGATTNGTEVTITDLNATGQQKFYRIQISLP